MAFGVQTPSYGEKPVSWQTFDNGSGSVPTIIGDPDWGKMEIAFNEQGRSRVYAFPDNQLRCITLSTDRYKSGDGAATPQIRGNSSEFAQDDNTIPWNDYTGTTRQTWRYVQMRVIKQT